MDLSKNTNTTTTTTTTMKVQGSQLEVTSINNAGAVVAMWHMLCIISSLVFWSLLYELLNPTKSLPVACLPISIGLFTYSIILNLKKRMAGRIQNTKKIRILKTIMNYFVTSLAAYQVREYHNAPDLFPMIAKSGVPISLGTLISSSLGLIVNGDDVDFLEVLGFGFGVYAVILVTIKRVEAYYVAVVFLLLCGGFCCSNRIGRLVCLGGNYKVAKKVAHLHN